MIIGYYFSGKDYKGFMFEDEHDARFPKCPQCGLYEGMPYNPGMKMKKATADLIHTYEGCPVVSKDFQNFCVNEGYEDVDFLPFKTTKDYVFPVFKNIVEMDLKHRPVELLNPCPTCQRPKDHNGLLPIFLTYDDRPLADGFYRTDFVSGRHWQAPVLIMGVKTMEKAEAYGLKGLRFLPIFQRSDYPNWHDVPREFRT